MQVEITGSMVFMGWEPEIGTIVEVYKEYPDEYVTHMSGNERHMPKSKCKVVHEVSAVGILNEAASCIGDRASERDTDAERSMASTIRAFNGMYGTELSEEQGWQFMVLLKMARAKGGDFKEDDYVDGAAYFALAGECRGVTA